MPTREKPSVDVEITRFTPLMPATASSIGRVTSVFSSVRETTQHAVIQPYVDFGSLDLVGVVVPSGSASDRAVIEADGSLQ